MGISSSSKGGISKGDEGSSLFQEKNLGRGTRLTQEKPSSRQKAYT